jgi:hypothetical protein
MRSSGRLACWQRSVVMASAGRATARSPPICAGSKLRVPGGRDRTPHPSSRIGAPPGSFTGDYEPVTPGSGTRPDDLAYAEQHNLPNDGTTGVGAVWDSGSSASA